MATPNNIYKRILASINDADVCIVAVVMEDHIGQDNAITMPELVAHTGMDERKVRICLEKLVKDYGVPIGAQSGKAGRYIISTEDERQAVIADLQSRVSETQTRIRALRSAKLVGKLPEHLEEPEREQQLLFDLPEPKQKYQWW